MASDTSLSRASSVVFTWIFFLVFSAEWVGVERPAWRALEREEEEDDEDEEDKRCGS